MSNCPRVDDAIAYALQQLTPPEAAAFQEHLEGCIACRLKLGEVTDTFDLLPFALEPVTPPADLKQKVLARVAADAQTPRAALRRRRWLPVLAAAVAVLAVGIGSYSLMRVATLQERLAGFEQAAAVQHSYALGGVPDTSGAAGHVVVALEGTKGTRVTLTAHGLPTLEAGQVYQLWLVKEGTRISGGVFVVDSTGQGGVVTWLPGEVTFDSLGVTREPDAFGLQPRGTKVMKST